jgi:hypothetical protein
MSGGLSHHMRVSRQTQCAIAEALGDRCPTCPSCHAKMKPVWWYWQGDIEPPASGARLLWDCETEDCEQGTEGAAQR